MGRMKFLAAVTLVAIAPAAASGATFRTLAPIPGTNDGQSTYNPLTKVGQHLYGTTNSGGANFFGTIFDVDIKTGKTSTVYSFPAYSGSAGALLNVDGTLYGITGGNTVLAASIFSFTPATGQITQIYSFARPCGRT